MRGELAGLKIDGLTELSWEREGDRLAFWFADDLPEHLVIPNVAAALAKPAKRQERALWDMRGIVLLLGRLDALQVEIPTEQD